MSQGEEASALDAITRYDDREDLRDGVARLAAQTLQNAIETRGAATLAVPGGSTPGPFLEALSEMPLDWSRVTVMPTDERMVALDSPRLNERLIRDSLLQGAAAAARFLGFAGPVMQANPAHILPRLCTEVEAALPLDLCVLGMGEDLHTASLFPGADRLALALAEDAPPVMMLHAPGVPEPRISLTRPALCTARRCVLLLAGAGKMAALTRAAAEGPVEMAPVRAILHRAEIHYAP
ncbi:MAG: 6-phosphogluconolactonase [Pseudomonadota bacterium]